MVNTSLEFRSLPGMWREYASMTQSHAFKASTPFEAEEWQERLSEVLIQTLGGFPTDQCDLSPKLLETQDEDGFTCELVALQTHPGEFMPCFVLIPEAGRANGKPVIALHGHGTWGAEAIIRKPDDPLGADLNQQLNYDYAGQLVRQGYLVFVPELRGFGKRLEDPDYQEGADPQWVSSCYAISTNALMLGKTALGLRVQDIMRLVDYIPTRIGRSIDTLGCVGLSGGGMVTLFATALDQRITCAVVSGYFNSFRDSIMVIRHCLCNFIPGIAKIAEMVDIAGLIAPRPLLIETGTQDSIFPTSATQKSFVRLKEIYSIFDTTQKLELDIFDGDHAWSGAKAYDWLAKWL